MPNFQVGTCYSSSSLGAFLLGFGALGGRRCSSAWCLWPGCACRLVAGWVRGAAGVHGMPCSPRRAPPPSHWLVLISLPGLASVRHTCTYSVHAARRSGLAARPHGRASPWRGGACKTKTGVVGVPTQGVQSGQLVVSYLLNMRPTTTTSVRWRGGLSVSPLRRKDGGAIGKSFTLGCMVSPP